MKYNHKDKPFKSLSGYTALVVIIAAIIFVSFVVSLSRFSDFGFSNGDDNTDTSSHASLEEVSSVEQPESTEENENNRNYEYYDKITFEKTAYNNSAVNQGSLVVVNSANSSDVKVSQEDLVAVHSNRTGNYGLRDYSLKMRSEAIKNIDMFVMSFYQNYPKNGLGMSDAYTASATGPMMDLQTGYSVKFTTYNSSNTLSSDSFVYLKEQAFRYGVIQRYPMAKENYTGHENNLSIYRYVGVAHSCYMNHYNLCLEEYLDKIRTEKVIEFKNPLEENAVYVMYYVAKDSSSDITYIDVPVGDMYEYNISGDGTEGFVVTVKLK